ncbi:MAG TPA: hypothetical protein VGL29_25840 [Blastocatellia bacterium]|jgi:hypothetical protein
MRRQRILLAGLLAAFILPIFAMAPQHAATAQRAAAAQKSTSHQETVTTTVFDTDATGAQLLMRSDDYNGVSQATYTTIKNNKGPGLLVDSEITTDGKWYLALSDQSGRRLWITPNQAIDSSQPAAPPADYYVVQKVYSVCRDQSDNIVPYENLVNGSGNCSLAVNFYQGGILYKLLMRPDSLDGTLCPSGGCPATGLAKVTCNAVSNNKCVSWTITPNAAAPLVGVANLYSYTGPRGSEWVFIGQYYNTFRINASNP